MPGFPFPGRPGGEHDEPLLDMIIARRALPPDAPSEMHDLQHMLAALARPAQPGELAAEPAVRAAFRRAASRAGLSPAARRPVRHRRTRRLARSRTGLATALVVAAAAVGGVLAAYADVLPSSIQQAAHVAVGAPLPQGSARTGSATSGAGQTAAHQARAAKSQQPATPHHSAPPTPASSQTQASRPRPTPSYSRAAVHPTTGATCGSGWWYAQGQIQAGPDHNSSTSSTPHLGYCGSLPTARPTVRFTPPPFAR